MGDCCCQSLVKRTGKAEDDKLPAAADVREKVLFDSKKKRRKRRHRKLAAEKGGDASTAGEHAQEYLELFRTLMEDSAGQWKSYLALRGALPKIGALIDKVSVEEGGGGRGDWGTD